MEVLRRCPLAIAQRLVHCAIALSTAVLDRVTKTMSVAPLLMNSLDNSKQKTSNLLSPAPPPYSWSLLGKSEGPAPPPSSKISWSFDLAWNPGILLFCFPYLCFCFPLPPGRAQELCEGRGGRPGLPVPNKPYGLCGRKAPWKKKTPWPSLPGCFYYFVFVCFLVFVSVPSRFVVQTLIVEGWEPLASARVNCMMLIELGRASSAWAVGRERVTSFKGFPGLSVTGR